ncbi:MAG: hypothetical protein DRJ07_20635 [Bacteroidetes bacterium]|nr:MAG: hypothetical protein DRJ07_20635 [Bacteroidota bacterium]
MQLFLKLIQILFFTSLVLTFTSCNKDVSQGEIEYFDEDNMPIVDGKRTFIIGSYHHPKTPDPFKTLSQNGYNYVKVNADSLELNEAQKNNLNTWIYTNAVNEKDTVAGKKSLTDLVRKYKDHSALLYWEIEDEPAWKWNSAVARVSPERMKKAYDIIKTEDPKHAIVTNHAPINLVSTLKKYNTSCDLVLVDVYPVIPYGIKPSMALFPNGLQGDLLNPYISQVGEYIDKMKMVVDNSRPVFAVLQGFSWEMLKLEKERDSGMVLYPTYEQSRFMAFNAIVHGVTGIVYWGTNYTPQPSKFMDELYAVTGELGEMQEILASKTTLNAIKIEYHEMGYSVDSGIEFITKEVNGKIYLIVVNSDKNLVKVTFSGLKGLKSAKVLKENRSLKIREGSFEDEFNSFGVHIYELN